MFNVYCDDKLFYNDTQFRIITTNDFYQINFNKKYIGFAKGLEITYKIMPSPEDKIYLEFSILNNYTESITFHSEIILKGNQAYLDQLTFPHDAKTIPIGSKNGVLTQNIAILGYDNDFSKDKIIYADLYYQDEEFHSMYHDIKFKCQSQTLQPFNEFKFKLVILTRDYIEPAPILRLEPNTTIKYGEIVKFTGNLTGLKVGQNVTVYQADSYDYIPFYSIIITETNKPTPISLTIETRWSAAFYAFSELGMRSTESMSENDELPHLEIIKFPKRDIPLYGEIKFDILATGNAYYDICIKIGNNEIFSAIKLEGSHQKMTVSIPTKLYTQQARWEVNEGVYNSLIYIQKKIYARKIKFNFI